MDYIPLYPFDTDPLRIVGRDPGIITRVGVPPPETPPPEPDSPEEPAAACEASTGDGGDAPAAARPDKSPAPAATESPAPTAPDGPPEDGEAAGERQLSEIVVEWMNAHWDTVAELARAGEPPALPAPPEVRGAGAATGDEGESAAAAGRVAAPRVRLRKGDRWTRAAMAEFLRQLAATHSVTAAAKAVGKNRRSAYKLRARLKGQPFDIAWETALRLGFDELAHTALELALEGEEVPHYHKGELVGTHRRRNPQLIVNLLKMRNQAGGPIYGGYGDGAEAEFWSENWEQMVHRVETGEE